MNINIVTTEHPRFDTRIWVKQILSLISEGFSVRYFVADGLGDDNVAGVEIIDLCLKPKRRGFFGRLSSMIYFFKGLGVKRGDVIHFHDGIFLPFMFVFWVRGCRIIYDVHEDYPRQVLNMRFHPALKRTWGLSMGVMEWLAGRLFSAIVAATPQIAKRFPDEKTVTVRNFPVLSEFDISVFTPYLERENMFAYVGSISKVRGIEQIVESIDIVDEDYHCQVVLAGEFVSDGVEGKVRAFPGWEKILFKGWCSRHEVSDILSKVKAGLVILHPVPNYVESLPVKMFEYMAAGLPVIASDFPVWRKIICNVNCGILVNPMDTKAIATAMRWILDNPHEAEQMGRRGREAVENQYCWDNEKKLLVDIYNRVSQ